VTAILDKITKAALNGVGSREEAIAVIAVIREPTQQMLDAARDWSAKKYGKPIGRDAAIGCWQAMHAAITAEI
jgi:hypothetical protein